MVQCTALQTLASSFGPSRIASSITTPVSHLASHVPWSPQKLPQKQPSKAAGLSSILVCVCVRALCCAVAALDRVEESRMDPKEFSKSVRTMVSEVFAARMHWHCTQCTARVFCKGVPNCILKRLS